MNPAQPCFDPPSLPPHEPARQLHGPPPLRGFALPAPTADPTQQARLCQLVLTAFSPPLTERLKPRVQAIAEALLDAVLPCGRIELIDDYAAPLPIAAIGELLGVPPADHAMLRRWSTTLIGNASAAGAGAELRQVQDELSAYLRGLFAYKRHAPGDDLCTRLMVASAQEQPFYEDELIELLRSLVVAGHATTTQLIGNGVLALLQGPKQLARYARDPSLLPQVVEELLHYRHTGPAPQPSASQVWHDGLGALLTRMGGAIAIGTLLRRAPALRLAVDPSALQWRVGPMASALVALPLQVGA